MRLRQFDSLINAETIMESHPSGLVRSGMIRNDELQQQRVLQLCSNTCCNFQKEKYGLERGNGGLTAVFGSSCDSRADHSLQPSRQARRRRMLCIFQSAVTEIIDINNMEVFEKSGGDPSRDRVIADVAAPVTAM